MRKINQKMRKKYNLQTCTIKINTYMKEKYLI